MSVLVVIISSRPSVVLICDVKVVGAVGVSQTVKYCSRCIFPSDGCNFCFLGACTHSATNYTNLVHEIYFFLSPACSSVVSLFPLRNAFT